MRPSRITRKLFLEALESRRTPATYTVNALSDTGAGAGPVGDLRYCLTQANANIGADFIDGSGVTGTILLSSELPTVSDEVTIFGPGAKMLDVDANLGSRVIQISGTGTPNVSFSAIKLTGGGTSGNGGIALVDNAKVSFTNCTLNNSSANIGGVLFGTSASTMTINSCTLSGSQGVVAGGAIYSTGTLNITGSTLSGNLTGPVGSGGAISLGGAANCTIVNSTLSGNSAEIHGGAIRTLSSFSGLLHIKNSTITNNKLVDPTGTGRGISRAGVGGTIRLESTILAQNSGGSATTSDVTGAVQADFNLLGTIDAASITGSGNITGTNAAPEDAKLGPLSNNGGSTLTHLPMNDSPARDAGYTPDLLTEDQRGLGFARTENYATDMGSIETLNFKPMAANIPIVVRESSVGTTFQFTVTYFDPRGSQLVDYSSLGTGDLYIPGPNGYYEIPTFVSATPCADAKTIVATYEIPVPVNGKAGWDLTDNGVYPLISYPNEVFDEDQPIPNAGDAVGFTFLFVEIPIVYTVDEVSDVVDGKTGAGEVSLREAINIANTDNEFSKIVFDSGVFSSATTITLGGTELTITEALVVSGPLAPLSINGNSASRIFNTSNAPALAAIELSRLTLMNGKTFAVEGGGGLLMSDEDVTLNQVKILNCSSAYIGGAISSTNKVGQTAMLTIKDSEFAENSAATHGGAIYFSNGHTLNIFRSTIAKNTSGASGGGLVSITNRFVNITESELTANHVAAPGFASTLGGAIVFFADIIGPASSISIVNSTISSNTAVGSDGNSFGGAIEYQNGSKGVLTIANSTVTGNTSQTAGGGIRIVYGQVSLQSSIIAGNTSSAQRDIYGMQYLGIGPATISATNSLIGVGDTGKMLLEPENLTGTKASPLDAKLGPLADNGGPTKTHALLPGSPAINAGSNVAGLAFDQRGTGFARSVGQTDIGAFEVQTVAPAPAKITDVKVNDGSAQRSRVTSLTITFDNPPTLPMNPEDGFQLKRQADNLTVNLDATVMGNTVTFTFTGGPLDSGSLADGRYTLMAFAAQIPNLDGDGNGAPGDDYVLTGTPANGMFRLFGDADGNGVVSAIDFNAFRLVYGTSGPSPFDFDNNGQVTAGDFNQFRLRYGVMI